MMGMLLPRDGDKVARRHWAICQVLPAHKNKHLVPCWQETEPPESMSVVLSRLSPHRFLSQMNLSECVIMWSSTSSRRSLWNPQVTAQLRKDVQHRYLSQRKIWPIKGRLSRQITVAGAMLLDKQGQLWWCRHSEEGVWWQGEHTNHKR